ncbi:helix-turn-helix domain-containing protein [uncultured Parasphingorhabdus sp.]|uniref:helix-turn-helix domain-containing protein n=1 Tax=uncultured Parasphingorhabdus sp. TaxID=2709694 RepID=UPI002AA7E7AF|nr:helix-turn-helix domain-containing protein [uncultured Parasphingorhabdus sp.]
MFKGVPIRSVMRALKVLQIINNNEPLSMMGIAKIANIPYPTTSRLVRTLIVANLVESEPDKKRYRPTSLVQSLSNGYQDHSQLVALARPYIEAFTRNFHWPLSLCTPVGEMIVIRDSTHAISPLTFDRYFPGASSPILKCGSGRVYLAHMEDGRRNDLIDVLVSSGQTYSSEIIEQARSSSRSRKIREAGYLMNGFHQFARSHSRTNSIVVPIAMECKIIGTLSVIFFANALKTEVDQKALVTALQETSRKISLALADSEL